MNKFNLVKVVSFVFIAVLILSTFSCTENDPVTDQGTPPTLPPQSTMQINFNDFPDSTTLSSLQKLQLNRSNWTYAALNVAVWNSLLTLTLVVPVAAFGESFNHQPVQQEDGSWLWAYPVSVGDIDYTVKLYGLSNTDGVQWQMFVSKEGQYTDFLWFEGFSILPATEGTWTLNRYPLNPAAFLYIEWHRNPSESTADIKFTNIVSGDPNAGSYIYAETTNDTLFNTKYHIYNSGQGNLIEIEWHRTTKEGRIKDASYFGDDNWYCWDTNLMNITCP